MKKFLSITLMILALVFMLASCDTLKGMIIKRTVSFDLNGGEAGEDYAESVKIGDGKTLALTSPTREGYNFLGWYSGETEITESTPITSDITLKAEWEIKSFTVSFVDYYGNTVSTQTVNFGESATAPTVESIINKQRFDGWSADFSKVVEDMTVTALYVDNTYTITYNLGDKGEAFAEPCFYGELPKIPETPEVDGYVFTGWFLDEELTERYFFDYKLDRDVTLYAKFYDTSLGEYIVISNVEQFKAIKDAPAQKYLLACDINCHGEKLTPIKSFSGELDGNGYKIHNFIISETSQYAGIINTIANAGVVKNLNVSDFTYTVTSNPYGDTFYGIIAALNYGIIENCNVLDGEMNISTTNRGTIPLLVGGICGLNGYDHGGTIEGCTNNATINLKVVHTSNGSAYIEVGGIVGRNDGDESYVINCINYGEISLHSVIGAQGIRELAVGGVCGWNMDSGAKIDNCANYADVKNTVELLGFTQVPYTFTGGVIGKNEGIINNSYSNGSVTMTEIDEYNYYYETYDYIGGFAGWNCGMIYNCYSTGDVSAMPSLELYAGGFIGRNVQESGFASTITKCFSTGSVEIIDDVADSTSVIYVGHFAGKNDVNIKDCYYLDSVTLSYTNIASEEGNTESLEATCTDGNVISENKLLSVDFIENTLYFDRMIWLVVEGQLPTLR